MENAQHKDAPKSKDVPKNVAASVRQRLSNLARSKGEDFGLLLSRFVIERLLFRLGTSPYRNAFVLKGATLFALWPQVPRRSTRDLDFLGQGDASPENLMRIFQDLCAVESPEDGLLFLGESVRVHAIREGQHYGGQRVQLEVRLENAKIPLQIDIGFGDAVTPAVYEGEYPTLLPLAAPYIKFYPVETVVAEKWQAMVELGEANSRMKDFYDVWTLSYHHTFEGRILGEAIRATFARRRTPLPTAVPRALSDDFAQNPAKVTQWKAFVRKSRLQDVPSLLEITQVLRNFIWPLTQALQSGHDGQGRWNPPEGWNSEEGSGEASSTNI